MKGARFLILVLALLALASMPTAAAPLAGPCAPGMAYDPACDADQNGVINITDIQLTAGHWNQTGTYVGDNNHTHLGQTWTGSNNPLTINGSFATGDQAALVLSNNTGAGVRVHSAGGTGVVVDEASWDGVYVSSAGSTGVYVDSAGTSGVYVSSAGGTGVRVHSAGGTGVAVDSAGWSGVYVYSAGWNGVDATSTSATYYGGKFRNLAVGGAGIYAAGGDDTAADLILGGAGADADGRIYSEPSGANSDLVLFGNDKVHVHLDEDNNTTGSTFAIYNGANTSVWSVGESGTVVAAGPSAVQVDAANQGKRLAYAVTSPQNWIEDFGNGQLQDGQAVIALEPAYAETISAEQPYHVFLTPLGDCSLYVAEKAATSFSVRALGGQQCNIAFDYRIVGLRRGYETVRMEQYVEVSDE